MQINIRVSTRWWPDMSKVPKIGSWLYLCNIWRKKVLQLHFCFILMQNIKYFTGLQSCLLFLYLLFMMEIASRCVTFHWIRLTESLLNLVSCMKHMSVELCSNIFAISPDVPLSVPTFALQPLALEICRLTFSVM